MGGSFHLKGSCQKKKPQIGKGICRKGAGIPSGLAGYERRPTNLNTIASSVNPRKVSGCLKGGGGRL